jgi:hypothetical protein
MNTNAAKPLISIFLLLVLGSANAQENVVPPTSEFTVRGFVKHELTLKISDLQQFKPEELRDVIIRNQKGEQKRVAKSVKGILLKTVLEKADIHAEKPKEYSQIYIVLTASDGYKNVYSWNELFRTEIGQHIYIVTAEEDKAMEQLPGRIQVMSLGEYQSGNRNLRGLTNIEVRKAE